MTIVAGLVFGGWDSSEFVEEASVIEPVDPFECGEFEVVEAFPWSLVSDEFGLVEPDDRFGQGVIERVTAGAD